MKNIYQKISFYFAVAFVFCFSLFSQEKGADNFSKVTDRKNEKGNVTFYFIDLEVPKGTKDKSGDSTLVISPDEKVMLIDCGHPLAGEYVVKTLEALGIKKIDIFVNTHPHIDHLGSFPLIAKTFPIDAVYRSKLEYDSKYTRAFSDAINTYSIDVKFVEDGDVFYLGDEVKIEVLGPAPEIKYPENYPANATQFVNNNSLTLLFDYGESKALIAGDLYRRGEAEVMDKYGDKLECDLAKANHHGNDTSSQLRWIRATKPKVVVAMHDILGSMTVVENYVKYGATFYHTLYNGLIKVRLDKSHHVNVETQYESWIEKLK